MPDTRIYPTGALAARAIADQIVSIAENSINARGRFTILLSGGHTPRPLYALLAAREFNDQIDWSNVHAFFSDERCVPPEHPDSNNHMVRHVLLDNVPIPVSHIYRIHGEIDPEQAAHDYEKILHDFFGRREAGGARFDLSLLGVGEDGHTASLFPGSDALNETERWVRAVYAEHLESWRVTLTPLALNAAQNTFFFVTGESKADIMRGILKPSDGDTPLPVHAIKPRTNAPRWYLDQAAARLISGSLDWMTAQNPPGGSA
jgi:6-phosphogluconolactonase